MSPFLQRPGVTPKHQHVLSSACNYQEPRVHQHQTPAHLNNVTPNATEYSQTIPYYTCTETNNQCVLKCNGDSTCQNNCRVQNPCGAQDPKRVNVTTTTTTTAKAATSTASETPVNTLVNGATGAAPRMASVDMSHVYGLCVLVGGFVAGYATLL
ncbi:hypothetical protein PITC_006570 [Penicillium italicum]|uniref:DUF7707 domain-containing protein n=1 Tax=Penicillium italicum TaxID=40296 RepID=A0A0A2L831_PENIT|nr:hypothetical protein PITC_006570 [Penicillium italicum]